MLDKSTSSDTSTRVSLEDAVENFSSSSTKINPEDKRQTFNTYLAGGLAILLWSSLVTVVILHYISASSISQRIFDESSSSLEEIESKVDKASALIDDTAKTIYSFLGPITAAITGFYYRNVSSRSNLSDD